MSDRAPFPWFGGKSAIASEVWPRFGKPTQYIEPFFGSGAVLLAAAKPASLEVVGDLNGFLANFWRAVKHQPGEAARWADYPVSHVDLGARHGWLMAQRDRLGAELQDPNWPGDAQVAGWWLWGQCCWIGSGWCEWDGTPGNGAAARDQVPAISKVGQGIHAQGQIPHASDAGMGIQAAGQIPSITEPGRHVHGLKNADMGAGVTADLLTSSGRVAWAWLHRLAARLERVRVVHGEWSRCLNHHYGAEDTAVFLDPPYRGYGALYGAEAVADEVAAWAAEHAHLRVALCGHVGDYDLPGWEVLRWRRPRLSYSGGETTDREAIWFSPPCLRVQRSATADLFARETA